jgi:murein DD-endopeptidase MepM/ murein hydrolase activator NlpD
MNPLTVPPALNGLEDRVNLSSSVDPSSPDQAQFMSMLSELLSSTGSRSSSNSLSGGGLLNSMIFTLVEQLLAAQLQAQGSSADQPVVTGSTPFSSSQLQALTSSFNSLQYASTLQPAQISQYAGPLGLPVHGPLTQDFHPGHNGLDFGVVVGTPAKATMPGKIVYAGWNNQGYGNLVIVQNGNYQVYYGHLSQIPVQVGETVAAGETIGLTGNTGHSTGPHLHYEVRKDGKPIDPTAFTLGAK